MLNERERGVLADIEQSLAGSDPHLASQFGGIAHVGPREGGRWAGDAGVPRGRQSVYVAGIAPRLLLAGGLLLIVLGAVSAAVVVLGTGIVVVLLALVLAAAGESDSRSESATG
ncbi:DUF3040 domain-containing protein [Pseudonocardia dioxanivorans]|uniref:DUF3040 domain-containing protein n=1 Tax=Pseudonocardia dioxanivorans TaxID=240495 RepID=UPI000D0316D4|nr:DUF3040 domain-containing protein [Pseudonocardia dioxanivorans]